MDTVDRECTACGRVTTHQILRHAGGATVACLRCRELDAEAAKLVEARRREDEIRLRADAAMRAAGAPTPPRATARRTAASWVALGGGILMFLAAFMPWITFDNPLGGSISRSGVDGENRDGWVLVGTGAIAALSALASYRSRGVRILWFLMGAIGGLVAGLDIREVIHRISFLDEEVRHLASVGFGLYLGALGAATSVVAAFLRK